MKFDILTIFPEMIETVLGQSIIGRARESGLLHINSINIRDFSQDKHKKTDDYPYGGGNGMVMFPQPIYDAYKSTFDESSEKPHVIYMSPQGSVLNQKKVDELRNFSHIVILCGHYEGVDERIIEEIVDEEISIGDYVLTGGELPAMVLIDAVGRTIPGVLSCEEAYSEESHYNGLLEYPQYTRPYEFNKRQVPDILLSGHHANITKWRRKQSLYRTWLKRPDLLISLELDKKDKKLLDEAIEEYSDKHKQDCE